MGSHAMFREMVGLCRRQIAGVLLCAAVASPAFAQAPNAVGARIELAGSWMPSNSEFVSNDTVPVDYTALPLNDEARARALSYSESQLGMVERQCEGWPIFYFMTGPFGLKIWSEFEPVRGNLVSYTIGAFEDTVPLVIWMDGRPHPSKYAEHMRGGFTTGKWEGQTLVTTTTHMKGGFFRKNGAPNSDLATMTARFYRHGNNLMVLAVLEDPIYLAEPLIWTRDFVVAPVEMLPVPPPCITTFEGTAAGDVPHFLWGKKDFMDELTKQYGIPEEVILGYPETLYPEYRKKMKLVPPQPAKSATR